MYPKKELAQIIIAACRQFEIQTVVISPGSRNAPLTIGFSNHKDFETLSIVDERCAAFFALGIAQQTLKPVALVCTSGSALLNYYPAIAEAYYSQIPLVVISADRPAHLIDIGDGQTIRQENVFKNHILYSANLKEFDAENSIKALSKAFSLLRQVKGPIHINAPFNEPLYETVATINDFRFIAEESDLQDTIDYENLASQWNSAKKKMILVGVHSPNAALEILLDKVADDPSVLVFTETTSNLYNKRFVNSIDNLIFNLTEEEFTSLQPDILLTFGGMIVSKKIKKFLRDYSPKEHWHVNELRAFDTYQVLSKHLKIDSHSFFKHFCELVDYDNKSTYESTWTHYKQRIREKHNHYIKTAPYSDLKVFEQVLKVIPDFSEVQFSNSAIIRYSQLFEMNSTITVFCNRGTSGIDGSTSTALGAAYATQKPTTLITGDLSFFYDSNALWNNYIPSDVRIVIINNSGGGIFKIIPGPKKSTALKYFETPHCLTAEHLCVMFGFEYSTAHNLKTLAEEVVGFYDKSDKPKVLEVFTPSDLNDLVLKEYINNLK
ncbi:2-succinyl-5-enolpyruvyl-6-hydroxy-3-cyclohexene-1-carboxylic-acid synthase [bacterium]|jgi:2-succinyl-5-enolpyruvyl-6-hydroxy-3-cyclohexene-1-carboxylate synthase|nr:2-succinyl-5-enolpyruvyl-6-hydroxy-3-cyclohexene-1-carboxylic-acid synthase [bacterium]MDB9893600.1 2-succinyl-5-enolpyruvyl-6-hydroxy-3-cyclohexene-1-carboxylic-acid synthase [Flavobacteriaceae bacterium]MDC1342777.1 2-succinyl-5-enolpyruvyl-6-hydroxy-3-cyclohexene-1-carboxylic-acid synthase [Flavobacteriaceae bacterium]